MPACAAGLPSASSPGISSAITRRTARPLLNDEPPPPLSAHPDISRRSAWLLLGRALLLRCPACGGGSLFTGFFATKERCPSCGLLLERGESDYFIGAYTVNLIAVEVLLAIGFVVVILVTRPNPPWQALQYGGVALSILGAVLCYPFAKTTWLAVDLMFRPPKREDFITRSK